MPKTRATGREPHSEQKPGVQQADHQRRIGGQGMGQGRGMNPGEVQRDRPRGEPGRRGRLKVPPRD